MSWPSLSNRRTAGSKQANGVGRRAGICSGLLAALLTWLAFPAAGQILNPQLDSYATGSKPTGLAIIGSGSSASRPGPLWLAVANSGENSVSTFTIGGSRSPVFLFPWIIFQGIPSPYGAAACNYGNTGHTALITSPADNSVTVISGSLGKITGKVTVGPQPRAVACFASTAPPIIPTLTPDPKYKGVVSNAGDDTLTIFDVASLAVEARIPGVAAAMGVHGIAPGPSGSPAGQAWVAGSSANVVTLVDLTTYRILARIPVRGPTSVYYGCVASSQDNAITCYDASLQPYKSISVPTPVDFALVPFVASTGTSLIYQGAQGQTTFPGINSAAGVAGFFAQDLGAFALVTSPETNRVWLVQSAPAPLVPAAPRDFSVVNGASFAPDAPVAPNSLASLFLTTGAVQNLLANSLPLPKALGGVSLRVAGSLAYDSANSRWTYSATGSVDAGLTYVGPSQINFQMPPGIAPGDSVPAQLQLPNGKTLLTTLRLVSAAPGIFSILMNGQGQGAVLNQDNSANGDPQRFLGVKPAARGSVIQVFATGAGDTTPALAAGEAAPAGGNPLVLTKVQPTVTIGGKNAKVLFSGMAPGFVGLWQINAEVPADVTPGMALPLVITAAGVQSNTVTIAVQ